MAKNELLWYCRCGQLTQGVDDSKWKNREEGGVPNGTKTCYFSTQEKDLLESISDLIKLAFACAQFCSD